MSAKQHQRFCSCTKTQPVPETAESSPERGGETAGELEVLQTGTSGGCLELPFTIAEDEAVPE